jgi:selenide,water dikinase
MPIVDDPFAFGAIAATNALSDVYAMGATPLFALALVAMPLDRLPLATIRAILDGGEATCARAGIPLAGGHTIDSVEPIYGLVAIGSVDPAKVKRNVGAMPGDVLVLGKPLGIGICGAALKKGQLGEEQYAAMLAQAMQLNTPGIALGAIDGVHALTDVTGFGLLGHLLEICRGSGVGARLAFDRVPLLPGVMDLARAGMITGGSARNWAGYGGVVSWRGRVNAASQALLTDPQTSGGLLAACAPAAVDEVLTVFRSEGFERATVIGEITAGASHVVVD